MVSKMELWKIVLIILGIFVVLMIALMVYLNNLLKNGVKCENVHDCPYYSEDSVVCNKDGGVYGFDKMASCVERVNEARRNGTLHKLKRCDDKKVKKVSKRGSRNN